MQSASFGIFRESSIARTIGDSSGRSDAVFPRIIRLVEIHPKHVHRILRVRVELAAQVVAHVVSCGIFNGIGDVVAVQLPVPLSI